MITPRGYLVPQLMVYWGYWGYSSYYDFIFGLLGHLGILGLLGLLGFWSDTDQNTRTRS